MQRALITAFVFFSFSSTAFALCKYKAADGSWTYAKTCAQMSEKEIDESATLVLKKNAAYKKPDPGIEGRRLRGFEYADTTNSGMRIRMVEPNKRPPEKEFTSR
ncbi:MAG: hypothetical protein BMS9Abin01_0103 [Gammaproteobacteria bacterium]|nr:MAG: hypothetical protein BMS9Abin01_0103 [Gammaproteobacteria bacterium]